MEKKITENQITTTSAVEKNIEAIRKLENDTLQGLSTVEHIADKVRAFAGSSPFILLHVIWFSAWVFINSGIISTVIPFDPFPFSFLTLIVSLEAIFLTLLVLMSQNRMTKEADKRAHLDLQINMLDEQETTLILRMTQKIAIHLGLEDVVEKSVEELYEETDINRVAQALEDNSFIQ